MANREKGTVAKWLNHKGIGFITPQGEEEGANDYLVHYTSIKQESEDGFRSLEHGSIVEYDLQEDPRNPEKKVAVNVTGEGGADCIPRTRNESKGGKGGKSKGKGKGDGKKGKKGKGKKGKD